MQASEFRVPATVANLEGAEEWAERAYSDLRRVAAMPRRSHFAAMEEPLGYLYGKPLDARIWRWSSATSSSAAGC